MAETVQQPSEIAREALRRLAMSRIPPTPDNYRTLFNEIAGLTVEEPFPERILKSMAGALPRTTPEQCRFVRAFETAVSEKSWPLLRRALLEAAEQRVGTQRAWAAIIRELMLQWDRHHPGITQARKRQQLDHVLDSCPNDADQLASRLQSAIRSWGESVSAPDTIEVSPAAAPAPAHAAAPSEAAAAPVADAPPQGGAESQALARLTNELRNGIADLLDHSAELLIDSPRLAFEARAVGSLLRGSGETSSLEAACGRLQTFIGKLKWAAEDASDARRGLIGMIELLLGNIGNFVDDDQWVQGQIAVVRDIVTHPLTQNALDEAKHRLDELTARQLALKDALRAQQDHLKAMLAGFVDHVAHLSESTSGYHDKIETAAERIGAAKNIGELSDLIAEVVNETRSMQHQTARTRDDIQTLRKRVDESESEIRRLQEELAETSRLVRHDQLTGALNRKGMQETLEKELARTRRRDAPLCVALLDVDDFKALNDSLGHSAGDNALVHLANVVRETIRPQDSLARFGGEEFLIMMPDTKLDEGVAAMTRLQRALTRQFFLHDDAQMLITFSAGVAQIYLDEAADAAIARADRAMYQAKRAGKNRVIAAP